MIAIWPAAAINPLKWTELEVFRNRRAVRFSQPFLAFGAGPSKCLGTCTRTSPRLLHPPPDLNGESMSLTPAEIAEAFSSHRFSDAYPQIADDVEWQLVGGPTLAGKAALVEACEDTERELSNTQTTFTRFRSIVGDRTVVVDSVAEYQAPDGSTTTVASCDLYDFDGETVVAITSYTVELPATHE